MKEDSSNNFDEIPLNNDTTECKSFCKQCKSTTTHQIHSYHITCTGCGSFEVFDSTDDLLKFVMNNLMVSINKNFVL